MDIHKSLRDNLRYKMLIEYPVLHVVLRDHWKEYPQRGPGKNPHLALNVTKSCPDSCTNTNPLMLYFFITIFTLCFLCHVCFPVTKRNGWCTTWVKTPCRPMSPAPLHFPNSSSIVSCPGFSSWDFQTPLSLIFHYGNMLPQRKWGCSAQYHTHQLNLNGDRVQKEDQTWLTVEQWPHEL